MTTVEIPAAFGFLWDDRADDGGPVVYRAAWGGRGSGKSVSFAMALVLKGAQKPLRILCVREIQISIKDSLKAEIEAAIERCGLQAFYQVLDQEVRGRNGTVFLFAGLWRNEQGIRSKAGIDICWVEEAQSVSQASLNSLDPTIRKKGSEIWFTWNPIDAKNPVDAMFRGGEPPPGSIVREVHYEDNPWFWETTLAGKMEFDRRRDPEKYQHIWRGQYLRNSEARVFRNFTIKPFETPDDAEFRFGGDWGFATDPTVLIRAFIGRWDGERAVADPKGRVLFIDREAYQVGCEIDKTPALFDTVPGSRRWTITADSARPETVSYMRRQGFKIVPAIKGPGSIEDGVEFLKSYDIVIHERCKNTASEFQLYSWKIDKKTDEVLPILEDKYNNCIDSVRYALEALRRKGPKWDEQPGGRNPRDPPDLWSRDRGEGESWKVA